jgi:hypothetical protein
MTAVPTRKPAGLELRFKIEQDPLAYLAMGNGHSIGKNCTTADIVRAATYTCCYLWMLAHPDFKPLPDLKETAREHARWLFEPAAFGLLTAGARTGQPFDLEGLRLQEFGRAFLASLPAAQRGQMKLQTEVPKGLWGSVKDAYGIKHGANGEGLTALLMACLMHARSIETDTSDEG